MLEAYREHVQERATQGIVPKPLGPEWTAQLVELLKNPPAGEEAFLLGAHIGQYSHGGYDNHEPTRPRKLLLHRE